MTGQGFTGEFVDEFVDADMAIVLSSVVQAARRGRQWLRLDAWRTNERLHTYYRKHVFAPRFGHKG